MRFSKLSQRLQYLGAEKWAVHLEGKRRLAAGEPMIMLSIGEPDAAVPGAILDVAERQMRAGRTRYSSGRGEPSVRAALARKYTARTGRDISLEQFIFVPGTQTALAIGMMLLAEEGDEVLLADPYYATYEAVIAAAGAVAVPVRTDPGQGFHLTAAALERAITPRSRVLLLNSPGNPTGAVLNAAEIAAIGDVCTRHDIWIMSDEVYETMTYGNTVFASPFDNPDFAARTMVVSSVSKSHAMPGFRCGWIAAAPEVCDAFQPLAETLLFGSQPFLEDATAFALENQFPEIEAMKTAYERRARALLASLEGAKAVSARMPEGGMFVMIDVRKTGLSGEAFAWRLLDERVVTMPGESFGAGGAGHLRIALTVPEADLAEAGRRIMALAGRLQQVHP